MSSFILVFSVVLCLSSSCCSTMIRRHLQSSMLTSLLQISQQLLIFGRIMASVSVEAQRPCLCSRSCSWPMTHPLWPPFSRLTILFLTTRICPHCLFVSPPLTQLAPPGVGLSDPSLSPESAKQPKIMPDTWQRETFLTCLSRGGCRQ